MITWLEKGRETVLQNRDIRISKCKNGKIAIYFYRDSWKRITKTGRIRIGFDDKHMYFAQADERGYKLSANKSNRRFVNMRLPEQCDKFVGQYMLVEDKETRTWRID